MFVGVHSDGFVLQRSIINLPSFLGSFVRPILAVVDAVGAAVFGDFHTMFDDLQFNRLSPPIPNIPFVRAHYNRRYIQSKY